MTKKDVEKLITENKQLKIELQKLKSKSDFYTEFSVNDNNITTDKDDQSIKVTPINRRKNMSIDLGSVKSYEINSYDIN
jgi:regulator of replication initiation timing